MTATRTDSIAAVDSMIDRLRTQLQMIRDTSPMDDPETVREILPVVAGTLRALQGLEEWLFTWRLQAWQAGRAVTPKIKYPELGELGGVSQVNIMKVLKKARDEEEARQTNGQQR